MTANPVRVGSYVRHAVMGWRGVIVYDMLGNPLCSERWKVVWNIDGQRKEELVYEAEVVPDEESE